MNSAKTSLPQVAYVLTGGRESGVSPFLAAISVGCLRLIHPEAKILLLTDPETLEWLKNGHSFLLDRIDEVRSIETGSRDPVVSNRYIKTQLPSWVEGPCLYLDNDTLPLCRLNGIWKSGYDFSAAPDYRDGDRCHVCPQRFQSLYESMAWEYPPRYYLNGGVFCVGEGKNAKSLFAEWNNRWRQSCEKGIVVDQPALNSLWSEKSWKVRILPREFNGLIEVDESFARSARIYHYTSSYAQLSEYLLSEWIAKLERGEDITGDLALLQRTRYIWKDQSHARRHWLTGRPIEALRVLWRKRWLRDRN